LKQNTNQALAAVAAAAAGINGLLSGGNLSGQKHTQLQPISIASIKQRHMKMMRSFNN
jgi:hypothetical protein